MWNGGNRKQWLWLKKQCASWPRPVAFILLGAITLFGLYVFFRSDWRQALSWWGDRVDLLLLVFLIHCVNMLLDAIMWTWILRDFRIRIPLLTGVAVYLTAFAGLLLPVQLGRFIRPDSLARLGKGEWADAVKAEFVLLYLSAGTAGVVVGGLIVWHLLPLLSLPAGLILLTCMLGSGSLIFRLSRRFNIILPVGYWFRPKTITASLLILSGWLLIGLALYLVVRDLPGNFGLWEALLTAPLSTFVGSGSGLPGGIGAVEAFLGVSLKLMQVPSGHLALAVGAFRLITFWIWIPIGWAVLLFLNRSAARRAETGVNKEEPDET